MERTGMMTSRRWRLRRNLKPEVREVFALTSSLDEIRDRFEIVKITAEYEPQEAVEPTDPVPIIVGRRRERRLVDARWGLFPFWAKDSVHADLHGVLDKPIFDRLVRKQRCIVPGTALATLREDGRLCHIVRMMPKEGGLFGMAGLYEEFVNGSGKLHRAFTIVTTDSRGGHGDVRSRMPLLLGDAEAEEWLNPDRKVSSAWPGFFDVPDEARWIVHTDVRRLERAVQA
jgi:putative SOS response-associated peptidase YedK